MVHKTGDTASGRGIYHSDCRCKEELRVRRGDTFPPCPKCRASVKWLFNRSFVNDPPSQPRPKH